MSDRRRVTLTDDEPLVLAGLRMVLEMDPKIEVVGEALDGIEGLRLVREVRPDVALVDVRMPRSNGIEMTHAVTGDPSLASTRVLVLTTFADDHHLLDAVRAGASGYLLKSMPPAEIRAAVHATAEGDTSLAPLLVERLLHDYTRRRVAPHPLLERLTAREAEVMREVAKGRSNAEIATRLYVGEGTVKTHVAAILRKLSLRDRTQVAVAAYEMGLVRPGEAG